MSDTPFQVRVLEYFVNHPGQHVFIGTLAELTGQTEPRAAATVGHIINTGKLPGLVKIGKGGPWMYRPNSRQDGPLFEQVAVTKTGTLILQSTDGTLYRAEEIQ